MPDYTILLIDYDPRSIDALSRPLMHAGYRVEVAKDGIAGVQRFKQLQPDLTLIEAMIPKKHGFEVCQELKATPHGQRSAVWIITSVYKGRKYRTQATHYYRCDRYLEKPISEEQLLEMVGGHFETAAPTERASGPAGADDAAPPTTEPLLDAAESEILDRLDSILPDAGPEIRLDGAAAPADSAEEPQLDGSRYSVDPTEASESKILGFDPARARTRVDLAETPGGPTLDAGRGGRLALARRPAERETAPNASGTIRMAADSRSRPARPRRDGGRPWIVLCLIAAIVALVAAFFLI